MEQLPQDVLQEIARRVNMRNRMALEATSRTMRAAVRPVTAEITRETRAALCRALKIAFGIRKVMQQFTDRELQRVAIARPMATYFFMDPQERIAFKKAIDTYVSAAKTRARPSEGAELTWRVEMDDYDTACHVTNLFVGYINGSRIDVRATIRPQYMHVNAQIPFTSGSVIAGPLFTVAKNRVTVHRRGHGVGPSAARLKKQIRHARRRVDVVGLHDLGVSLQEAFYNRPEEIAIKVATRAIKACATSLHATMW